MLEFKFIRKKLLFAFLVVIFILFLLEVIFVVLHFRLINEYKAVTDKLIVEHKFMQSVPELIQAYGNVVNGPKSSERLAKYNEIHIELENSMLELDDKIVYKDSKLYYSSLKNIVNNILKECDKGIQDINNNNLSSAFSRYEYIFSKNTLIAESTANLMGKELEYAEMLQNDINKVNKTIFAISSAVFILVLGLCLFFVWRFANKMTKPLIDLAALTKDISGGNLNVRVDENLLKSKDEMGILSRSINDMIGRINAEVEAQKKAREELEISKQSIVGRNEELEKFNKMVVDRELKMTELKSKIKELEDKLNQSKK